MNNPITEAMTEAITGRAPAHTITVTWTNGTRATYSANMLDMLRTDPAALDIQDDDTGEIIYIKSTPTEEAPQAAQEAATAPASFGVWLDDGSATDSQTARDMIRANFEHLEPDDPARAEQLELLAELDRQPAQEPKKTTQPAEHVYRVYFTDNPYQAATFRARTKREAEKAGRLYIRKWQLDARIDRIERDDGELLPF